ncbi:MAG: DNA-3-methyladenine glycosylase [Aggregatilineales bacterium]
MSDPLPRAFYARSALVVARDLLGARLVRAEPGQPRVVGLIVETEAYTGLDDLASHGRHHRTPRNAPMWGPPGHAYVYLSRGIHWMLNAVVEAEDTPAAVLIRAIHPLAGLDVIAARRPNRQPREWTSGPARLTVAIAVNSALNRADLTTRDAGLWIEPGEQVDDAAVRTGPRIGLGKTPEPWLTIPWRWWIANDEFVSR